MRKVLEKVEKRYGLKLPRKVVTVDYGDDVGDLFVRLRRVEHVYDCALMPFEFCLQCIRHLLAHVPKIA